MTVIDTLRADQIEVGDYITIDGIYTGQVLGMEDNGDTILIELADEDEYGDRNRIHLDPDDHVELLGY